MAHVSRTVKKKKNYRHSSTFYRKLRCELNKECDDSFDNTGLRSVETRNIDNQCLFAEKTLSQITTQTNVNISNEVVSSATSETVSEKNNYHFNNEEHYSIISDPESDCEEQSVNNLTPLDQDLRSWALNHKLSHRSVNDLLHILRKNGMMLPSDARCLLQTPKSTNILKMGNGEFWYNGIETCILQQGPKIAEQEKIFLIFNIDGLPPYKSATTEFWSILCKIENFPHIKPMVIAIYSGLSKPPLHAFFSQFIDELNSILENGITYREHKIHVGIKYFVCDTPARSFIKGTVGFNSAHGCLKCSVIGEYDKGGRHMSFPRIDCPLRTDHSFRSKVDEDHHKEDSPLLKLPIDIVEDIIIADSLHLFDLGVMRKCLYGWIYGNYNFRTKLSGREIELLSEMLEECNNRRPSEIHRAIRSLKCLKFWKGSEYRTFLLYLGPVVLKKFLSTDAYHNFLTLCCAVTILSCKTYLKYIQIADQLLKDYIEQFINIYGIDAVSSNVHNLCHVTNDVKKFGHLPQISSYPFENFLGQIKSMLRNGNRPLAQIARRVIELSKLNSENDSTVIKQPYLKNERRCENHQLEYCTKVFNTLYISDEYMLSNNLKNMWFMTKTNEIVSMINGTYYHDKICIYGSAVQHKGNFFEQPIKSSYLNIYKSDGKLTVPKLYRLNEIKCKLISLRYQAEIVFLPLIHTMDIILT